MRELFDGLEVIPNVSGFQRVWVTNGSSPLTPIRGYKCNQPKRGE